MRLNTSMCNEETVSRYRRLKLFYVDSEDVYYSLYCFAPITYTLYILVLFYLGFMGRRYNLKLLFYVVIVVTDG